MGADNIAEFSAALEGREAIEKFVEEVAPGLLSIDAKALMQAFRTLLSPVDAAAISQHLTSYLIDAMQEGIRDSRAGWIDDDLTFTTPWGFDPSQIQTPLLLLHGEQDRFVPFAHGKWLASKINTVEARLSTEDGHLTLSSQRIPEVHAWLLSKM